MIGDWPSADAHAVIGGGVAVPDGGQETHHCQLCGNERRHVEAVELPLWPEVEVDACPACQYAYADPGEDICPRCGGDGADCYVEIEGEIAGVEITASLSTTVCAECGGDLIAFHLTNNDSVPLEVLAESEPDPSRRANLQKMATEGQDA